LGYATLIQPANITNKQQVSPTPNSVIQGFPRTIFRGDLMLQRKSGLLENKNTKQ